MGLRELRHHTSEVWRASDAAKPWRSRTAGSQWPRSCPIAARPISPTLARLVRRAARDSPPDRSSSETRPGTAPIDCRMRYRLSVTKSAGELLLRGHLGDHQASRWTRTSASSHGRLLRRARGLGLGQLRPAAVEVARASSRIQPALLPEAWECSTAFSFVNQRRHRGTGHDRTRRSLRSLDAIHLATARGLADDLAALVSYDERLLTAATMPAFPLRRRPGRRRKPLRTPD